MTAGSCQGSKDSESTLEFRTTDLRPDTAPITASFKMYYTLEKQITLHGAKHKSQLRKTYGTRVYRTKKGICAGTPTASSRDSLYHHHFFIHLVPCPTNRPFKS